MGEIWSSEARAFTMKFCIFLCCYVFISRAVNLNKLYLLSRYKSVRTYATVSKDSVELVDFRLTRVHSDSNGQPLKGPQPTQNPSEEEFQSLIKNLSLGQGLEQLVRNTATENGFRYRHYKELSAFVRGLTLNFPEITSLHRLGDFILPQTLYLNQPSFPCKDTQMFDIITRCFSFSVCQK